jgi:hypothetical protein
MNIIEDDTFSESDTLPRIIKLSLSTSHSSIIPSS